MEKDKQKQPEQPELIERLPPQTTEHVVIGDLSLASAYVSPEELCKLALCLLKNKEVKELLVQKKINGSANYTG